MKDGADAKSDAEKNPKGEGGDVEVSPLITGSSSESFDPMGDDGGACGSSVSECFVYFCVLFVE